MGIPCAGAVVVHDGRLLLVRRGQPPAYGLWSLPGGRVEPGETTAQAAAREVLEETGLRVDVGALLGSVQRPAPGGGTYDIHDHAATVHPSSGTEPVAATDALDARWVADADLARLDRQAMVADGLLAVLREWGVLPLRSGQGDG